MKRYIIIYTSYGHESILHSDNKFYNAFFDIRGCHTKIYKRQSYAQKMVNELSKKHNCDNFFVKEI